MIEFANKLNIEHPSQLTRDFHVLPDFHSNRSSVARPEISGMKSGLTLNTGLQHLAVLNLATIQAFPYSSKHIIDKLVENGY